MDQTVFEINGEKYSVVKRGIAQANQVAYAGRWLAIYGTPALKTIQNDPDYADMGGVEMLTAFLGTLSGDALVDLFDVVFGCGVPVAREYFEIDLMVDGLISIYQNAPAIKRLVSRFFSKQTSKDSAPDSSTQSE